MLGQCRGADTEDVSQAAPQNCMLRLVAQGEAESCPQEPCPFWEPGGAVAGGGCLVERLGIDYRRPDLATYLLETRTRLEQARTLAEAEAAHREFAERLGLDF
jgi:hypothetical protein